MDTTTDTTRYHISSKTRNRIAERIGADFVLISWSCFQPFEGVNRTRYTVKKPRGRKFIHLIEMEDGTIR
jgi:hypothetical protein